MTGTSDPSSADYSSRPRELALNPRNRYVSGAPFLGVTAMFVAQGVMAVNHDSIGGLLFNLIFAIGSGVGAWSSLRSGRAWVEGDRLRTSRACMTTLTLNRSEIAFAEVTQVPNIGPNPTGGRRVMIRMHDGRTLPFGAFLARKNVPAPSPLVEGLAKDINRWLNEPHKTVSGASADV